MLDLVVLYSRKERMTRNEIKRLERAAVDASPAWYRGECFMVHKHDRSFVDGKKAHTFVMVATSGC